MVRLIQLRGPSFVAVSISMCTSNNVAVIMSIVGVVWTGCSLQSKFEVRVRVLYHLVEYELFNQGVSFIVNFERNATTCTVLAEPILQCDATTQA